MKVVVVGGGILGLWIAAEVAKHGFEVDVHEKYEVGHQKGSSHGDSRIFRTAYWEGAEYVALARKSRDLWFSLNQYSGKTIYDECGGIYVGSAHSPLINGVRSSANSWGIDVLSQSPDSIGIVANKDCASLEEKHAGIIYADVALSSIKMYCLSIGVNIFENSHFDSKPCPSKIYIFATGPWLAKNESYARIASSDRVYCHWFRYKNPVKLFEKVFLLQGKDGRVLYGMRPAENVVKVGWHNYPVIPLEPGIEESSSPKKYIRDIGYALSKITDSKLEHVKSQGCYFTNSLDENYIVDRGASFGGSNVWHVGGLSGHGFKFAPALGFFVAKSIVEECVDPTVAVFNSSRFVGKEFHSRTAVNDQDILVGRDWYI